MKITLNNFNTNMANHLHAEQSVHDYVNQILGTALIAEDIKLYKYYKSIGEEQMYFDIVDGGKEKKN